jgi:hypothetical protein
MLIEGIMDGHGLPWTREVDAYAASKKMQGRPVWFM